MKFLSWMQNKFGGKQENRKPNTHTSTTCLYRGVGHNQRKCPFSAEHGDILAYGFWGSDDDDSRDDEQAEDEKEDDDMDLEDEGEDDEDLEEDNDVDQEREDDQELLSRYSESVEMV